MKTLLLIFITFNLYSYDFDKKEEVKKTGTILKSGKKDSKRIYQLTKNIALNAKIDDVIKSILIYDQKCNKEYAKKRELISKDKKCKYHNENLIETKVHTLMDKKYDKFLVLERRIYNRELFSNVDMVTVKKMKNGNVEIRQRMLKDNEAKRYIKDPIKRNSVFSETTAVYILNQKKEKVHIDYKYEMVTDHWLLNKSIAASRVFESMKEGTELLFESINSELGLTKKEVTAAL